MFTLFPKKAINYFSAAEKEQIRAAIHNAEKNTTGEVRVFVEHFCKHGDAVKRAAEVFHNMKMDETADRNGTLVYIAIKHKRLAIYADTGIYSLVEKGFWEQELQKMKDHFTKGAFADGLIGVILEIGAKLSEHFPAAEHLSKNEIPDELVFGKR